MTALDFLLELWNARPKDYMHESDWIKIIVILRAEREKGNITIIGRTEEGDAIYKKV